jgi:type I restriction-modification system DNA methylase subunit
MGEKANDGGQFFTPREIIRAMVRAIDPKVGETVYDPGCGTGGFIAQRYEHMRAGLGSGATGEQIDALKQRTFFGREKENLIYPIALANLVGKKTPFTLNRFDDFFARLPARDASDRSWTVERSDIEAKDFDLKAVNPNAKSTEDTRWPEELLGYRLRTSGYRTEGCGWI